MDITEIKDSSLLKGHGYDPTSQTLRLVFHNGTQGDHGNVSQQQYEDFLAAPSAGKWYHANLRGNERHPWSKLDPAKEETNG